VGIFCAEGSIGKGLSGDDDALEKVRRYGQTVGHLLDGLTTQEALKESEELYRSVVENAQAGIFIVDDAYCLIYVNDVLCQIAGYSREQLVGQNFQTFLDQESRELVADRYIRRQRGEDVPAQYEFNIVRQDGEKRRVQISSVAIQAGEGARTLAQMLDVTERSRLERQLQELVERRARQVETTTEVAQEIAAAPELEELYRRVVNLVKERFGYYHSQLFLLDREGEKLVTVAGYGEVGQQLRSQGHFVPVGQGVVGRAGQEGKALLSADVTQDPGWLYHPLLPETKGELAVPIMLRDKVLGVLDVQSDRAGLLSDDDLLLLEGLCGQIAIAIESTRLRQEMEESLRELERIYRTMSREGWEAMQRDLGAKGYLFDRAQIVAAGDFWLPQMARAVETQAVVSEASAEGITVVAPLATRGEIVGALGVHDAEEARLSPEEVALVEQVAEQVTQALESARLFDEEQRARSLLDMRVGELDCLNDIGRKIDEGPPVAELLSWVAGRVPAAMQYAQICRVAIEFEGQVYGRAEALTLPRQMVQALRVGGRVSGKICIAYTQDRAFLDEESALLGDISRRIGGYVENRRLFRQTQARAEELTVLNELGQTLPACLSVDSVLDEAYRAASRLLDADNFYVTLYNAEAGQVVFPLRIVGEEVERPYSVRPVGRGGLTDYLLDTRRSLLLRDNLPERMDALGIKAISLVPGRSALSWLGVPMMMGDRVLGTMVVLSYETSGAYDEHDRGLLTAVANQVAIALENVNLLEQARARAERERLVRTITDRVRRGMDRDAILRITLQEVGQMLGASKAVVRLGTQKDLLSDAGSTQKDNSEGG
jgi:PAS domain S-box-containing protein